jgi:hypothetical protein
MVYVNTLLVQKVLSEKEWLNKMQPEDFRGLTPLFYGHITPYGEFQLDINKRINIEETMSTIPQRNKTGNEKRSFCSAAHLFYSVSTSQNLEVKSAVKMGDYKPRNWLDR